MKLLYYKALEQVKKTMLNRIYKARKIGLALIGIEEWAKGETNRFKIRN